MHVYKFRILSDEQEDFLRDVEILATQTFEDFYYFLIELLEYNTKELASFSICNGRWYKQCEITLIDMKFDEKVEEEDDEDKPSDEVKLKTYLMADSRIKDFVDDPHQRMIFEYDFLNLKTFFLELFKILPAEEGVSYPRCVRSEGQLPKKNILPVDIDAEDMDEDQETNSILDDVFVDELDENFANNLDDGFEIEIDSSVQMNMDEPFDGNPDESGRQQ